MADFYREEIAERKIVGYLAVDERDKFALEGNKLAVEKEMESIIGHLKENENEPLYSPLSLRPSREASDEPSAKIGNRGTMW